MNCGAASKDPNSMQSNSMSRFIRWAGLEPDHHGRRSTSRQRRPVAAPPNGHLRMRVRLTQPGQSGRGIWVGAFRTLILMLEMQAEVFFVLRMCRPPASSVKYLFRPDSMSGAFPLSRLDRRKRLEQNCISEHGQNQAMSKLLARGSRAYIVFSIRLMERGPTFVRLALQPVLARQYSRP